MSLRVFRSSDAAHFHNVVAANKEHLGDVYRRVFRDGTSLRAAARRIAELRRDHLSGEHSSFAIFPPDESDLIGCIALIPRIGAGASEIGYWIASSHVRKGYASEAAAAMTRIGFEVQHLHRLEIHTDPANQASIGVARRIGFREQVMLSKCVLSADGPIRDSVIWSMSRDEFFASSAAGVAIDAMDRAGNRVM